MSDKLEEIDETVTNNEAVIFMKGTVENPQCGFSEAAVEVLKTYDIDIQGRDVLKDDQLRRSIKEYADWPTIPQVYINGEFVGGSDIVREMHQKGDLEPLVEQAKAEG